MSVLRGKSLAMRLLTLLLLLHFTIQAEAARGQVPTSDPESSGWTLESDEDGVKIYVRPEDNGDMSVRVRTAATATVEQVQAVIDNAVDYPEWVHRCAEARVLPGGTPAAYTYYSLIDLPFPFSDREVVAAIEQRTDPVSGVYTRDITSTPNAVPVTKGPERVETYEARWIVSPQGTGRVTIECTVRTAAGSGLPNWLRTEVMTGGPAKTVVNLVERLERGK